MSVSIAVIPQAADAQLRPLRGPGCRSLERHVRRTRSVDAPVAGIQDKSPAA